MAELNIVRIDGIKWWITQSTTGTRLSIPLCPEHDLRMTSIPPRIRTSSGSYHDGSAKDGESLLCAEGQHNIDIPRKFSDEERYVLDRIDAKIFKGIKVLNLDDEALPIAKAKVSSKNDKYFISAQLMESKRGIQVVVYAGEKGGPKKTQIFIEPEIRRLAFDQKDLHPSDVFLRLEATFEDGSSHTIQKATDHL